MPSGKLFKYRCKELLCNALIRSDKWTEHCRSKHAVLFNRGSVIKKVTVAVKEKGSNAWRPITAADQVHESEVRPTPVVEHGLHAHEPSPSTSKASPSMSKAEPEIEFMEVTEALQIATSTNSSKEYVLYLL